MTPRLSVYKTENKKSKSTRKAIVAFLIVATIVSSTGCSSQKRNTHNGNTEQPSSNPSEKLEENSASIISNLPSNYKASLDDASLDIIKSSVALDDTSSCNNNIMNFPNSYPNENIIEVEKALNRYFSVTEKSVVSTNIIKEGKIDVNRLCEVVLKNNEEYLKESTSKKYNSTTDAIVDSACHIMAEYFSRGIETENIDLNSLDYKLSKLKIFVYNEFAYGYYSEEDGILGLNTNAIKSLEENTEDSSFFKKVVEHEFAHIIQAGINVDDGERMGVCYFFDDLTVNSLYWVWYFEGSAEQLVCKANGTTSSETYLNEIRCLETIKTATVLGNESSLENISLQNDLNVLFDYFNCKDDSQKIEVINMMYAYNIIDRDDLCKDFFDSYEKEHGEEMSWSQKMDYQTQLKGNVAITLSKQFYTNLCTRINGKQVKMEDLFSIISIFETELCRQTWYNDPTKTENLYPFLKSYTEIQTEMFEMIAKYLNLTTEEVQKAYNAYNDNFNVQNLNIDWLLPNEYGGLELTVEAELFYTPGRSYFTPPDGHILQ